MRAVLIIGYSAIILYFGMISAQFALIAIR